VTLAVVNCQLYSGGLFNAYDAVAKEPKLDAIVHLGDYIYEYGAGPDDYGMAIGGKIGRIPEPPHELLTLADYRRRHAQYKTDPDLQAAHARAAFICVWDDHEAANDAWTGGAENHQPATEGDWVTRRTQAIRAYYEWMPIREPAAGETSLAIQRRFDFGDLASLHMVETRFASRSHQLSFADMEMTPAGAAAFDAKRRDPARQLLGPAQARWLADGLKTSHAAGRPWQVLGNQVVMAEVFGPDVDPADPALVAMLANLPAYVRTTVQAAIATSKLGLPQNMDAWDGYPAERDRLYAAFQASGARPLVLSGDSHAFWGNQLKAGDKIVAVELGVSSITSPSNGDALPDFPLGPELAKKNNQVLFCDQRAKGYVLLTLRRDEAIADYRAVSTIVAKPYDLATIKRYRIPADPAKGHLIEA
jgi:alkaline phosphatase D